MKKGSKHPIILQITHILHFMLGIIWVTYTLSSSYEQMFEETDENDSRIKFVCHSNILGSQK